VVCPDAQHKETAMLEFCFARMARNCEGKTRRDFLRAG
jgi:hypothetical protein